MQQLCSNIAQFPPPIVLLLSYILHLYMLKPTMYCAIYPRICHFLFLISSCGFELPSGVISFQTKGILFFPVRQTCCQQILLVITYLGLFSLCLYFWRTGSFLTEYRIFACPTTTTAIMGFHFPLVFVVSDEKSVINCLGFLHISIIIFVFNLICGWLWSV